MPTSNTINASRLAEALDAYAAKEGNLLTHLEFESGVSTRTIYAIREGRPEVEVDTADRLCLALQIPLSEVLPIDAIATSSDEGWCGTCRDDVALTSAGTCPWCAAAVRAGAKRGKKLEDDLTCISAELLHRAYMLYAKGHSLRRVAAAVQPGTGYASERACAGGLYGAWKLRGWKLRSHAEAVANRTTNPCASTRSDGKPCRNGRLDGSDYCKMHDPARREADLARLATMRASREANLTHTVQEIRDLAGPWVKAEGRSALRRLSTLSGVKEITLRGILVHSDPKRRVTQERATAILEAVASNEPNHSLPASVVIDALRPWREAYGHGAVRAIADRAGLTYPTAQKRLNRPDRTIPLDMAERLLAVLDEDVRTTAIAHAIELSAPSTNQEATA